MECALGQLGEDLGHRVHPLVHLQVGNCQKFRAVSSEMSVEKVVHEVHLTEYVDQVEKFTEDELVGIGIMFSNGFLQVFDHHEPLLVDRFTLGVQGKVGQILQEQRDFSSFQILPEEVGEIAGDGLEEEDENDPLIPGMSDLVTLRGDLNQVAVPGGGAGVGVGAHPGVGEVHASPASQLGGEGEGAVDPAVGVEHRLAHSFHHAVNWLPEKLCEGLQGAADAENGECELVVESEGGVVDQASLQMEQRLKIGEH